MKVLSIKEPFATLISNGKKTIETRSWKTKYRGEIYIHASISKIDKKTQNRLDLMKILGDDELHYGKIICKCNLVDCIYMNEDFVNDIKKDTQEYICGHYEIGRYAWVLDNIEILDEPIDAKGKLGIWNYEKGD
jgi:hypothetical protein